MITNERKAELETLGYYVEDMGSEYGLEFDGMYRWMNSKTDAFQDSDMSFSEDAAWIEADLYEKSL